MSLSRVREAITNQAVFAADLHIHSVLSPCGDLAMSPSRILARAQEIGLDLIAITDHNMVENGAALGALAQGSPVSVLYGMELETLEEIHLLCLFDHFDTAMEWQEVVYQRLPSVENDPDRFGDQVVVDGREEILRFEPRLLANATDISLDEACDEVAARGGLVIAAHVDRQSHSVMSQLGFLPPGTRLHGIEVTRYATEAFLKGELGALACRGVLRFSDAHFLHDLGAQRTFLRLQAPTVSEISLALRGERGRQIVGYG